ncbi:MAG: alanine--tRNA ligase, partial [Xanthomonadaceae bacterium]|nr:alanine--tRNA ligase [Rhodospirillaceae bacterium]NIA18076.1 alanine--tRNA ligase [Xanthomonadaceae bacterium]
MFNFMTAQELRKKYIEFFIKKGHQEIPSASLVPENDPSALFTTAGMHPLVPYLMGEKHPKGKRLVSIQKCVRTGDIEDVGDSTHNTFFEMLGNWSLGDYFKEDSIRWSWEFLTDKKWLNISPKKIKITVFKGDNNAPKDEESIKIWQECFKKSGISAEVYDKKKKNSKSAKIFPLPKKDNWWGPTGETGPCGPDTEIFIDLGKPVNFEKCPNGDDCKPGCSCGRYVEIWNNVFMEYNKKLKAQSSKLETATKNLKLKKEYEYVRLEQKNVDTGMGLERTLAILNGFDNVYKTDVFAPLIAKIRTIKSPPLAKEDKVIFEKSTRIIADHIRTSVFIISDGVEASNLDRGYVLRKLLRRAIRYGNLLKMPKGFLLVLAKKIYKNIYPELEKNKNNILDEIKKETAKFEKTLVRGLNELEKMFKNYKGNFKTFTLTADILFDLYQTYGFPIELSLEEINKLREKYGGIKIPLNIEKHFQELFKEHQELSRTASAGMFKGGLADNSEQAIKYHTATHLLLAALRQVLGNHVYQKGSNINSERLRFDFSHPKKLSNNEKRKVEILVNEQIQKKLPVTYEEMSLKKAKESGAMGIFNSKYGDKVKVYTIGKKG